MNQAIPWPPYSKKQHFRYAQPAFRFAQACMLQAASYVPLQLPAGGFELSTSQLQCASKQLETTEHKLFHCLRVGWLSPTSIHCPSAPPPFAGYRLPESNMQSTASLPFAFTIFVLSSAAVSSSVGSDSVKPHEAFCSLAWLLNKSSICKVQLAFAASALD